MATLRDGVRISPVPWNSGLVSKRLDYYRCQDLSMANQHLQVHQCVYSFELAIVSGCFLTLDGALKPAFSSKRPVSFDQGALEQITHV